MENVSAEPAAEARYTEARVAGDATQQRRQRWLGFAAYACR